MPSTLKSTPLTPPRRADPRQSTKSFWQCVFLIKRNHIYDELDRTDNPELKKKVELIKRFIGDVLVGLPEDASVEEAYVDFEDKERNEEIEAFAKEKDVDADKIKQIISEYEFSHTLTKDMIKEKIPMALPFRERRALIQAIIDFITQNCDMYQ